MVQQLGTNTFTTAKWIVSATASDGTHTTIAAALTSASSGDTIFIRPGTYTENITLKAGVNLTSFEPTAAISTATPSNVIINGKCSFSAAGTVGIKGVTLKTNSDFALAVTGSSASIVILDNCFINCSNNTGISFTSSSASSLIEFHYCTGDLATTGIALFAHSGAGTIVFRFSDFGNTGGSTTANTVSGTGSVLPNYFYIQNPITLSSSSSMVGDYVEIGPVSSNTTVLTTSSTASVNLQFCNLASGTASAVSIGSGTTVALHQSFVSSSNANAITGSGTLIFTSVVFNSSSGINSTVLRSPFPSTDGWRLILTQTASSSASISFTNLTKFNNLVLVFSNVTTGTTATQLQMQVSTDNGSSYIATNYQSGKITVNYNSATWNNSNSTTAYILCGSFDTTAGNSGAGRIFIFDMLSGAKHKINGSSSILGGGITAQVIAAGSNTATSVNALQLAMSSGNIATGTFTLYGISD